MTIIRTIFPALCCWTVCVAAPGQPDAGRSVRLGTEHFAVEIGGGDASADVRCRFDHAGRVRQITVRGVPMLARQGLVDEFGISGAGGVYGYAEATAAQPEFLKVGIGVLARNAAPYTFEAVYPVRRAFPAVLRRISALECEVRQRGEWREWRYDYRKHYRVDPLRKELTIRYTFANLGKQTMNLEQYNHNFLAPAAAPWDGSTRLQTDFELEPCLRHWIQVENRRIALRKKVPGRLYYTSFAPSDRAAPGHRLDIVSAGRTRWVLSGDRPLKRFALFAAPDTLCPELFVQLKIPSGRLCSWSRTYQIP